ncbi:MAG: BadF/BadG/BcrA/BcrD ATPase family protein [Chloroflexota bacterium]
MDSNAAGQPSDWLVLGADIGGTSTRILLAGYDGAPLRRGSAGGGNPVSHPDTAAAALAEALREAFAGIDPARVRAAVVGVAGGSALDQPEVRDAFDRVWSDIGLSCSPTYAPDLAVAFASGTADADGTVVIAGTGAVAGAVRDRHIVRTADGHGWLLGDDGSGYWLGREAARVTLGTLDADEPPGALASSVLHELGATRAADAVAKSDPNAARARVIHTLNTRAPVRLAELAPLVVAAAAAHDPEAERIVDEAARLLARTVARIRQPDEVTPIVLAGSLAREDSPVGAKLRTLVGERFQGPLLSASNGVGGAAWLALAEAEPSAATDEARTRLTAT